MLGTVAIENPKEITKRSQSISFATDCLRSDVIKTKVRDKKLETVPRHCRNKSWVASFLQKDVGNLMVVQTKEPAKVHQAENCIDFAELVSLSHMA